jgi:hypothetical protein
MTVAVQIEFSGDADSLLLECILLLAKEHPDFNFIVFCTQKVYSSADWSDNCRPFLIEPSIKKRLILHYWCQVQLPLLLKKHRAAIFISENGFCALRSSTPQIILIKDNGYLGENKSMMNIFQHYRNRHFEKFAQKATAICVANGWLEPGIISRFPALASKTTTVLYGIEPGFSPLHPDEKMSFLEKNSNGMEYFVCECSELTKQHLVSVLKAFSIFKKRLKSSFKLILLNKLGPNPISDFHLYKYRNDVQIISAANATLQSNIIAAAYAAIFLPTNPTLSNWGVKCMQLQVPLIAIDDEDSKAIYGDAGIFSSPDEISLSERLMQLYKDESFRNSHLLKGINIAEKYNWNDSAAIWWQTILSCQRH